MPCIDPAAVHALFARAPHAKLVGVPTGPATGFLVVDIDPAKGGDVWEAQHRDQLPDTLIHQTQHQGRHYVLRHVAGIHNSVSKIAPGIDIRAEGGYVIYPPSPGYTVVNEAEIAEAPAWLVVILREIEARRATTPRPIITTAREQISDTRLRGLLELLLAPLRTAPEGQKHDVLLRRARLLGGYQHLFSYSEDELVGMLLNALPDTVEDWKNAEKTARDGLRHGARSPLELEDRPRPRGGMALRREANRRLEMAQVRHRLDRNGGSEA